LKFTGYSTGPFWIATSAATQFSGHVGRSHGSLQPFELLQHADDERNWWIQRSIPHDAAILASFYDALLSAI